MQLLFKDFLVKIVLQDANHAMILLLKIPQIMLNALTKSFRLTFPIFIAYIFLGAVFGIVFTNTGFAWYLAPLMSAVIYGGTVQFVTLSMISEHAHLFAIVFTTFFIAFRNAFYGLSLIERFKCCWWKKCILIFGLVDATYAIIMANPPRGDKNEDIQFCLGVTLLSYIYWVIGTVLGAYFANFIPNFSAMNFIMPCFFMVLALEFYLINRRIDNIIIPIISMFLAYWLLPNHYLLLALCFSLTYLSIVTQIKTTLGSKHDIHR